MAGVNGVEIKLGQVWRTRGGEVVTVVKHDSADREYPWRGSDGDWYTDAGRFSRDRSRPNRDLIELVKDENGNAHADSATLAEETMSALGWTFDGQAWTEQPKVELPIGMVPNALDVQVGGTHYKDCAIQPIEYIHANKLGFAEGNVVKYITRHRQKHGADDVRKVIHYCQLLLELEYSMGKTEGGA